MCAFIATAIFLIMAGNDFLMANDTRFLYDSREKRDPFVSLLGRKVRLTDVDLLESINDVKIEGVIVDEEKGSAAIVNGRILRVGDFMGGFQLVAVTHYEVVMARDGKEYTLSFRDESVDNTVSDEYN